MWRGRRAARAGWAPRRAAAPAVRIGAAGEPVAVFICGREQTALDRLQRAKLEHLGVAECRAAAAVTAEQYDLATDRIVRDRCAPAHDGVLGLELRPARAIPFPHVAE